MNTQQPMTNVYEVIDAYELAKRWSLPESWIREQTRTRSADPLPCIFAPHGAAEAAIHGEGLSGHLAKSLKGTQQGLMDARHSHL